MKSPIILTSLIALMTSGCVSEMRVHEQIGPISGDLIRTIEGPTDEGGGVRVSGIQTFSRSDVSPASCGGGGVSTRTVRKKLCDGRVVTRRVTTPAPTVYQQGWKIQDSQFFAGPGTLQTTLGAAVQAAGFAGGMYLGRPPKVSGDSISVTQQGGGAVAHSAGGNASAQGGSASAQAAADANATAASTAASRSSTKLLNQQSYKFHVNNPLYESKKPAHEKPVHHKPAHDYKPKKHD